MGICVCTQWICASIRGWDRRLVSEYTSLSHRTGEWMVITAAGNKFSWLICLYFLGHSSKMNILHFSVKKIHTQDYTSIAYMYMFITHLYVCLYWYVRLSSPRNPVLLNNSATLFLALKILDEILKCWNCNTEQQNRGTNKRESGTRWHEEEKEEG